MTPGHELLAREAAWWWPRVADHLWQATLFALIVLLATFALKRGPARVRHSFWVLASAKFIVPAALFVFLAEQVGVASLWLFGTAALSGQNALLQGFTEPVWLIVNTYEFSVHASDAAGHNEFYCVLTGTWLTGCLTLLAVWAIRRRRFLEALKRGRSVQSGREWQALKHAQESLTMTARVELVISSRETEPTVCRVWKPVIMLPESIAGHLDDVELKAIMLHELVHIQRRDNLIGNLQMAVCALLWFHPLVWFISRKLFDEREQACDEKVLEICGTPEAYASSILKVVRFSFGWKIAGVIGAASGTNLRRRIENIMSSNNTKRNAIGPRLLAGTLLSLTLILIVVAGMHSRAESASGEVAIGTVESNEPVTSDSNADLAAAAQKKRKPPLPPQEPQPPQPAQESQPSQPTQASQPTQPSQPAQPHRANQRTQPPPPPPPASMSAKSPPPPPASMSPQSAPPLPPPTKATQEKSGEAKKEESAEKKDKQEKGVLIEAPPPAYPEEAKKQKIEGTVAVDIVIGHEGNVVYARPSSGPELLQGAAREAAFKARFKPTMLNGQPVKVTGVISYTFVLAEK